MQGGTTQDRWESPGVPGLLRLDVLRVGLTSVCMGLALAAALGFPGQLI
jgi:hypothetical protein